MTLRHRSAALSALSAAIALLVPAALAQALPVMTTSTSGSMFTIDITGANANKAVWFLQLPAGIDRTVLPNIFDTAAAGAQVISTGRTSATGSFHASFPVTVCPVDVEYAGYTQFAGIRFLGTMVPNPSASSVLEPGVGFTGPTPEPGQIGTGTAKAIARWDVVPYQTIVEATTPTFKVGVVAFHIAGIDRVEMSVEGGTWTAVRQMRLNPQTGVWEYWATIDARDFAADRPIELRAIAYPKAAAPQAQGTGAYPGGGYPRLLDSLRLYVDAGAAQAPNVAYCSANMGSDTTGNGTEGNPFRTLWKAAQRVHANGAGSADGGIVYMDAGTYAWNGRPGGGSIPTTADRWLTFRPWPGVSGDQVLIAEGVLPSPGIKRVHLYDVTIIGEAHGVGGGDAVWLDHSRCRGEGITSDHGGWTDDWSETYWTTVESTDSWTSVAYGGWLRDVHCQRNIAGPRHPRLVINSTWDTLNNGGSAAHPDFLHWHVGPTSFDNSIVYGVRGTNLQAEGFFFKGAQRTLKNTALVNVLMEGPGVSEIGEDTAQLDHLLLWNVDHLFSWIWQMPRSEMSNISIRGSVFGSMSIRPGFGDSVDDAWFEHNHYNFVNRTPGTNVTTGDPMWQPGGFVPAPNSPLRNRLNPLLVPIDAAGTLRPTPGTVGAFE